MNGWFFVWWGVAAIISLAILIALFKGGTPLRSALTSACGGVLSLLAVDVAGMFTGVSLALNALTLGCSAVLGVPGVITLLVLKTVFAA